LQKIAKIQHIAPQHPAASLITAAAGIIRSGGIVCLPTRSLYGLGADALNGQAVERVFRIKQRPAGMPLLVLLDRSERLNGLAADIPPPALALIENFWPGRVTLVFRARRSLPQRLTGGSGKIGVRVAGHPVAAALAAAVGGPITGTSANLSGRGGCDRIEGLDAAVAAAVDLVLDAGPLEGGTGSTVVDVTTDPVTILRVGSVPAAAIHQCLGSGLKY
jgi:L-threonylcarbamoyladenylate synthase